VNTHIIDIKAASEDPEKAATIANTVASMYGEVAVGSGKRQALVLGKAEAPQLPSFPKRYVAGFSMLLGGFFLGLGTSRSGAKPRNQSSPAKAKPSDPVPY
jgi:capsular polysaccharide biosynthesis protein